MHPAFDARYFARYYRSYERQNPPRKLAFYRDLAARAAAGVERPRLLELGCAFGRFLATLDPGWQRFGIDPIEAAIEEARRKVPGAQLAVAGVEAIPFAGPFDVIAAFDVLEHVTDLERARADLRDRLAPGGHLLFVVPVYDGPLGPIVRALDRDPTHVHQRSRGFWLDWLRPDLELVTWLGAVRYLLPFGPYLHWPTRRGRRIATAIAVLARRAP